MAGGGSRPRLARLGVRESVTAGTFHAIALAQLRRRADGSYRQRVSIQNLGGQGIYGPLTLVLDQLSRKVKVRKQTGMMHGSPFKVVPLGGGVLHAGETRTVMLELRSPSRRKIRYAARVLAGIGTP